ncbi:MAG: hypothetical protein KY392_04365, partial [Chloroflexi bacterium]|nr:hypothetical protein [Chloroflexota bacterium]
MGRRGRIGIVLLVVIVLVVAWEPTRVAVQTAAMLPTLLDAGPKPLDWFSDDPRRESRPYRAAERGQEPDLAEVWLPAWASAQRPAGGMLLVFGVNNLGRNHPAIARVAEGLARTGVVVVVPDSRTLLEGRLEVGEIAGVVHAFQLLAARPEVDRQRLGIVGFSVGGSLALRAASDPRIQDQVRWVNAFGAFADATTYLASVAAHAYLDDDGMAVPWTPTPLAREVYLRFLLDQVTDRGDREALREAFAEPVLAGDRPAADPDLKAELRTEVGATVHDLLTAEDLSAASAAIAALPASSQA